jgi:hypothetical protein
MGFTSWKADPDFWQRPATKDNNDRYYEYILTYVDDCLVVSHKPSLMITTLQEEYNYRLKDVGEPTKYLGAEVGKYHFSDGKTAWYTSANLYLKQAIAEVERGWGNITKMFPNQILDVPIQPGSHPEMHVTKFLGDDDVQLYQSYIGIIRWAVELGRIDLAHAAGAMASFLAAPREGLMFVVFRMFAYFKKPMESKLVFDPLKRDFGDTKWVSHDWKQFYLTYHERCCLRRDRRRGDSLSK